MKKWTKCWTKCTTEFMGVGLPLKTPTCKHRFFIMSVDAALFALENATTAAEVREVLEQIDYESIQND